MAVPDGYKHVRRGVNWCATSRRLGAAADPLPAGEEAREAVLPAALRRTSHSRTSPGPVASDGFSHRVLHGSGVTSQSMRPGFDLVAALAVHLLMAPLWVMSAVAIGQSMRASTTAWIIVSALPITWVVLAGKLVVWWRQGRGPIWSYPFRERVRSEIGRVS